MLLECKIKQIVQFGFKKLKKIKSNVKHDVFWLRLSWQHKKIMNTWLTYQNFVKG